MKLKVEQIDKTEEEKVIVYCYNEEATWVHNIKDAALGQKSVCGYKNNALYKLRICDIYYFEVVDGTSFLYTQNDVYQAREKLYEFENATARSSLFRCSKSMILNADKIDYVRPSVSGRFEAVLSNGEIVIVSRKYVMELKRLLSIE